MSSFRSDSWLCTWLVCIAVNNALGLLRSTGAQVVPLQTEVDSDGDTQEPGMQADPDEEPETKASPTQVLHHV